MLRLWARDVVLRASGSSVEAAGGVELAARDQVGGSRCGLSKRVRCRAGEIVEFDMPTKCVDHDSSWVDDRTRREDESRSDRAVSDVSLLDGSIASGKSCGCGSGHAETYECDEYAAGAHRHRRSAAIMRMGRSTVRLPSWLEPKWLRSYIYIYIYIHIYIYICIRICT